MLPHWAYLRVSDSPSLSLPYTQSGAIEVLTHMSVCIIDEGARSRAQQIK